MATIRSFLFIIIMSFVLLHSEVQSTVAHFNVEKYCGIWYQVGFLNAHPAVNEVFCEWFNAKIDNNCVGCIKETYGKSNGGRSQLRSYGNGTINNTELRVSYLRNADTLSYGPTYVYDVEIYDDGNELILRDRNLDLNTKILSRSRSALDSTKILLGLIASKYRYYAIYPNPEDCTVA